MEVGSINYKDTFFYAFFFLIIHRMFFCALTDFGHWQNLAMHEDRWLSLRTLWLLHEWHPQKWIKWLWTGMLYKVILYKSHVEPWNPQKWIKWLWTGMSFYISPTLSHGTEYEIWAGFGPIGGTKNFGLGRKVCYFWGQFVNFHGQKIMTIF